MIDKALSYIISIVVTFILSKVGQKLVWGNKKADGTPKKPWPVSPPHLPFLQQGLSDFNTEGYHALTRWSKELGNLFSVKLGFKRVIVLNSADLVHKVAIEKEQLNSSRMPSDSMEKLLTDNCKTVFTAPFSVYWSRLRRATYLVVGKLNAHQFSQVLQQQANRLSFGINATGHEGTSVKLTNDELRRMVDLIAMDTALTLVMGKRTLEAEGQSYDPATMLTLIQKLEALESRQSRKYNRLGQFFPVINALLDLKSLFTLDSTNVKLKNEILEVFLPWFESEYQQKEQKDGRLKTILKSLLHIEPSRNDPEPIQLKKDEVLVNLVHITFHAYTFLSATLFTVIQRLAVHPDLQPKIRDFGEDYARAFVAESLRFDPPQPLLGYSPRTEYELDNFRVEMDTELVVNVNAIHRNAYYYSEPDTFSPNRFYQKSDDETVPLLQQQPPQPHQYANKMTRDHLAFGAGRRACIGNKLSEDFLVTIVQQLTKVFELKGGSVDEKLECKTNIWSWLGRTETQGASIEFIKR